MVFYYNKLFKRLNLWPTHFLTLATYAVSSLLYNGSHKGRRLFFPYLSQSVHELISENALLGGFASTQAKFVYFNSGMVSTNGPLLEESHSIQKEEGENRTVRSQDGNSDGDGDGDGDGDDGDVNDDGESETTRNSIPPVDSNSPPVELSNASDSTCRIQSRPPLTFDSADKTVSHGSLLDENSLYPSVLRVRTI